MRPAELIADYVSIAGKDATQLIPGQRQGQCGSIAIATPEGAGGGASTGADAETAPFEGDAGKRATGSGKVIFLALSVVS